MSGNEYEEGVGHHSVIKINGKYFAVYHGREPGVIQNDDISETRTARFCKLRVENGVITAERF